jgi:hypothetical protein
MRIDYQIEGGLALIVRLIDYAELCVFSIAGNIINPRRRVMTADKVQELLCLRSWQKSGLIDFNNAMFTEVVQAAQDAPIADELMQDDNIDSSTRGDNDDDLI